MTVRDLVEKIHQGMTDGMIDPETPLELWYEHPDLHRVNLLIHSPEIEVDKGLFRIGNVENITW